MLSGLVGVGRSGSAASEVMPPRSKRRSRRASTGVGRLVLAHLGRPTIRGLDSGELPAYGEVGGALRIPAVNLLIQSSPVAGR
jgi:hypothetical protein